MGRDCHIAFRLISFNFGFYSFCDAVSHYAKKNSQQMRLEMQILGDKFKGFKGFKIIIK